MNIDFTNLKNVVNELKKFEANKFIGNLEEKDFLDALKVKVIPTKYSGIITGIDSGSFKLELIGKIIVGVKSAASSFDYSKEKLSAKSVLTPVKIRIFSYEDNSKCEEVVRLKEEYSLALNILKESDLVFLDGSVIPHPSVHPNKDSEILFEYSKIIEKCKSLNYSGKIVGISKDSKSRKFSRKNNETTNIPDIKIFNDLLEENERSGVFEYSVTETPILKELGFEGKVFSFYLKSLKYDYPLRIDFYCEEKNKAIEKANEIASIVCFLSKISKNYAYPAVLIDVDLKAKINSKEVEMVKKTIEKTKLSLRRNSRPFR